MMEKGSTDTLVRFLNEIADKSVRTPLLIPLEIARNKGGFTDENAPALRPGHSEKRLSRASYALVTRPALIALTETHSRFTCPLFKRTRMRWTLGRNFRRVFFTRLVPMPPLFLVRPFRVIRPPLTGRLPVIAQIRDIKEYFG